MYANVIKSNSKAKKPAMTGVAKAKATFTDACSQWDAHRPRGNTGSSSLVSEASVGACTSNHQPRLLDDMWVERVTVRPSAGVGLRRSAWAAAIEALPASVSMVPGGHATKHNTHIHSWLPVRYLVQGKNPCHLVASLQFNKYLSFSSSITCSIKAQRC